jgi:heme-degrading monooxygenase HmoA
MADAAAAMDAAFVALWEFEVEPAQRAEFERAYGPQGGWVRLFRAAAGYLGSELLRDQARAGRYVTLDRWRSRADWQAFHDAHADAYARLDRECLALTRDERALGEFEAT